MRASRRRPLGRAFDAFRKVAASRAPVRQRGGERAARFGFKTIHIVNIRGLYAAKRLTRKWRRNPLESHKTDSKLASPQPGASRASVGPVGAVFPSRRSRFKTREAGHS